MKTFLLESVVIVGAVLCAMTQVAHAGSLFADQDVDPRFRAKIMKEKAKQNQTMASEFNFNNSSNSADSPQCGSQSIGNVDTGGKFGTGPREVFVFAPNAVNVVSSQGCK
jgi:hypothetical protein